ncbi:MAG: penicillin-binding transpeptidase domain-containing protein [Flavisolibacter sp.]
MKTLFLLLLTFILFSCSTTRNFPEKDVCYMLFNVKTGKFEEVYNQKRCEERFPACSTFKVALSVMAFDSGILKDEQNPVFKWDKVKRSIEPWNKDQTPTSWMRESVVWVSQEITPKLGAEKIQKYLDDFDYGNKDITGGLKYSWLTPAKFVNEPMQNTLKISGYDQVKFLTKLWHGELKASHRSQAMTKTIMAKDESPRGGVLIGKTGSGFTDENQELRIGWFVGHVERGDAEYIVAINFSDKQKQHGATYGGREAKEMALKLLTEKGLW